MWSINPVYSYYNLYVCTVTIRRWFCSWNDLRLFHRRPEKEALFHIQPKKPPKKLSRLLPISNHHIRDTCCICFVVFEESICSLLCILNLDKAVERQKWRKPGTMGIAQRFKNRQRSGCLALREPSIIAQSAQVCWSFSDKGKTTTAFKWSAFHPPRYDKKGSIGQIDVLGTRSTAR